jgi:hypothetical protein
MDESEDARSSIWRRRAQFVAAALATTGVSALDGCSQQPDPRACLQPAQIEVTPVEAGAAEARSEAGVDANALPETEIGPRICLDFEL